jgi:hypothetical protein
VDDARVNDPGDAYPLQARIEAQHRWLLDETAAIAADTSRVVEVPVDGAARLQHLKRIREHLERLRRHRADLCGG